MELVLPASSEYALRAAACLAASEPGRWVPSHDLVASTHVPPAYLSKVLRRLVAAGILDSVKGHHGGFRLSRPADQIRFADVLRAMEDSPLPTRCRFGLDRCSSDEPCPLHGFFADLERRISAWSEQCTLADVDAKQFLARPVRHPLRSNRGRARAR